MGGRLKRSAPQILLTPKRRSVSFREVESCRICGSDRLLNYLNLGSAPTCNSLLDSKLQEIDKYPTKVLFCEECNLSQLSVVVDPKVMYTNYPYHSSVSRTFRNHCNEMAFDIKKSFSFKNDPPTCMDIASNDGALLKEFRKHGFAVRGFEPCRELVEECQRDLIPISNYFFTKETSMYSRSWSGEDVITATNVLAHIDDIGDFIKAVKYQLELNNKGIFIAQFPYLVNLINSNEFDTIYHEHLSYFLLKPLMKIFNSHWLPIFKVERHPIHGGSLRIYASQKYYKEDESVKTMLEYEEALRMYDYNTYLNFAKRVDRLRIDLVHRLVDLEAAGKKVMGYGASAKGISLLNYCGIPNKYIHSIVDDTQQKQGKFTPGSKIPIVDFSNFEKERPDYILLFAWNFAEELISKTKYLGAKYIIPIPEVKIV